MRLSQQRVVSAVLPARHSCRGLHAGGPRRCRPPCGHAGRRRGPPRPRRGDCCAFQRRRSPYRGRALWRSGAPRRGGLMSMSTSPSDLLRPDLQGQTPYGAPQLDVAVALNTNENSYAVPRGVVDAIVSSVADVASGLNRYPDREFVRLREDLAAYLSTTSGVVVTAEQVWAGNGSNEVLLHLLQAFGGPARVALGFTPAYSMHPIITRTVGTRWVDGRRGIEGAGAFDLDVSSAVAQVRLHQPDMGFLCSPNNPTGTAWGLFGLPYHLSAPTQAIACAALKHADGLLATVEALKTQRDRIVADLAEMGLDPVPSDANFVLFGGLADERVTWQALLDRGILIRDVGLAHYLRVTAGTPQETGAFLEAMRSLDPTHRQEQSP